MTEAQNTDKAIEVAKETLKSERTQAAIQEVVDANPGLIRSRARADLFRKASIGLLTLTSVLTVALLIWLSLGVARSAKAIEDCTNPTGTCFQATEARLAANTAIINQASENSAMRGSEPAKRSLNQSYQNGRDIQVILGVLDSQFPDAAKAVRAQIKKEGTKP